MVYGHIGRMSYIVVHTCLITNHTDGDFRSRDRVHQAAYLRNSLAHDKPGDPKPSLEEGVAGVAAM